MGLKEHYDNECKIFHECQERFYSASADKSIAERDMQQSRIRIEQLEKQLRESSRSPGCLTADAIVDDLFRSGFGDEAERLVLDVPGRELGNCGGWCRAAVRGVIIKHLSR